MKYVITCLLISVVFLSCQKEEDNNYGGNNPNSTPPTATLKYKFDGVLVEMNGSLAENSREGSIIRKEQVSKGTSGVLTNTDYIFALLATKNHFYSDDGEPVIEIEIRTNSLTEATYSTSSNGIKMVKTYYPQQASAYTTTNNSSNFTITITKLLNGYADGTFSGKMAYTGSQANSFITEGEFKNVRVLQ